MGSVNRKKRSPLSDEVLRPDCARGAEDSRAWEDEFSLEGAGGPYSQCTREDVHSAQGKCQGRLSERGVVNKASKPFFYHIRSPKVKV